MLAWLGALYLRLWLWWRFGRREPPLLAAAQRGGAGAERKLKEQRANRGAWIARGCGVCATCGNAPFGMLQPRPGHFLTEIGCLACPKGRRVRERTRDEAVSKWNSTFGR